MRISILSLIIVVALLAVSAGCTPRSGQPATQGSQKAAGGNQQAAGGDALAPAEKLAKRVVLYKLGVQEGDLAPFTAKPEEAAPTALPAVAKQINQAWWKTPWGTTRLASLAISDMSMLEDPVFPLIAVRLDDSDSQKTWCLYTLGYNPDDIRPYIANAHANWRPEERDLYLNGTESGCCQVWCVKVSGEWRIAANLTCIASVTPPTAPVPTKAPPGYSRSAGQGEQSVTPSTGNQGERTGH
jgi:hypothetical protein